MFEEKRIKAIAYAVDVAIVFSDLLPQELLKWAELKNYFQPFQDGSSYVSQLPVSLLLLHLN